MTIRPLALLAAAGLLLAFACKGDADDKPPADKPAETERPEQVPEEATGLGDLAQLAGIDPLSASELSITVSDFATYSYSGDIRVQISGELTNNTGHVLTDGELVLTTTVEFDDACPAEILGSRSFSKLGISESRPLRPGESKEFTLRSDDNLPEITGEFPASSATIVLSAFVEDPICYRARGELLELPLRWSAATTGGKARGKAITTGRVYLSSAADGGSRVETLEEATEVTVTQAKGRKLRVKSPGGTEGWASNESFELANPKGLFK